MVIYGAFVLMSLLLRQDTETKLYFVDFRFETFQPMDKESIKSHRILCGSDVSRAVYEILWKYSKPISTTSPSLDRKRLLLLYKDTNQTIFVDKEGNFRSDLIAGQLPKGTIRKLNQILWPYRNPKSKSLPAP